MMPIDFFDWHFSFLFRTFIVLKMATVAHFNDFLTS